MEALYKSNLIRTPLLKEIFGAFGFGLWRFQQDQEFWFKVAFSAIKIFILVFFLFFYFLQTSAKNGPLSKRDLN